MVRIKSRWLLINIRFAGDDEGAAAGSDVKAAAAATPAQVQLLRLLREALHQSFGDVGAGAIGGSLAVRYYSPTTHNAIVRCARQGLPYLWAACAFVSRFEGRRARLTVIHCGGAIRKVQQAAIRADRRAIERLCLRRKELARQQKHAAMRQMSAPDPAQQAGHADLEGPVPLDEQAKEDLAASQRQISAIEQ